MYKLIWALPFKVERKLRLHNAMQADIFDKYYFAERAESLLGPVYCIYSGTLSFDLYARWEELLSLYRKHRELRVDIGRIRNIISSSKVLIKVYVATQWSIGIVFLVMTITDRLSSDELILLIRTFRRRSNMKSLLSLKGQNSLTASEGLIQFLKSVLEPQGIVVSWDTMLENLYHFVIIDKSIKDSYSKQEIFGILTRTLNYIDVSDHDLKRLFKEIVEMSKDELIHLGPYSGGAFTNFEENVTSFYEKLILVLLFTKYIIELLYTDAVELLTSRKYKTKKLRKMLNDINVAKLLITPCSLTSAYKFNNEILPLFMKTTRLYDLEKSLKEVTVSLESLISKNYNERIQLLLLLLTLMTIVLTVLQTLRMLGLL